MFVFIVDNQMSSKETISALDYCKYAIECFVGSYSGADISSAPPMMLLQTGQSDECLLSSFGDPISLFEQKLKNIDCKGVPRALTALDFTYPISYALGVVNTYRMKSGVDTFGHGRALWLTEPVNIVIFTSHVSSSLKSETDTVFKDDSMFVNSKLRWDQRVSIIFASGKEKEKINESDKNDNNDDLKDVDKINERDKVKKDEEIDKDKRERDKSLDAVSIKLLRESTGLLVTLSKTTQGDVYHIKDAKEAFTVMRPFTQRLIDRTHSSVTVALRVSHTASQSTYVTSHHTQPAHTDEGNEDLVHARLIPTDIQGGPKWPIPECFWVDPKVEKFPPRDSYPILTINRKLPYLSEDISGKTEQGSPQYFLDLAAELHIPIDTYELAPSPGAPLSIKKSLAINTVERCHVTVAGCGRPDIQDSSGPMVGAAFLASIAHNNANIINGSNQGVAPFAILTPRSKVPGSCELKILPFNYPILLPIIKKALDHIKKSVLLAIPSSKIFSQPWIEQVKKELGAYLHTVPTYVYPCVGELLRCIGLEPLTKQIISKQKEERIHRNPFKTIQAMRGIAIADIVSMKAAAQLKWPPPTPSTVELAISSCEPGRRVIVPQNAAEVKPKDMRSVYEMMRRIIFGGGERLELQNIYYKEQGQGEGQKRGTGEGERVLSSSANKNKSDETKSEVNSKSQIQHNTYLSIVKNNERSYRMVVDMGRFVDVLARKEALRDPLLIDSGPEENSLQGLMNRKIVVDFGNRYKDEKGVGGSGGGGIDNMGMEIETSTGVKVIRQEKVQIDEDKNKEKDKDKDREKDKEKDKEKEKQQLALLLDQTHTAYFMDTPLPPAESDEGDEGEGGSDIGYGDPTSYLYTPMTISDGDNDNDDIYNSNDDYMDTDSEFDKEVEVEVEGVKKGQGQGQGQGERKVEKDEDPYSVGEYWSVIDVTTSSPDSTTDDTNSTNSKNSSPHTDSNTPHTYPNTHTLGIADRAHDLNVQTPSFTLSPLSSTFTSSSSSTPVAALTSVTNMLALPPLGRPYASLNGKRKRQAGMGTGGIALHLPPPTTPPSSSSSPSLSTSTPTSTPTSSSPFSDTGDDGRSSPVHGKGQRQGSREDQYTPHSPVPAPSGGRKDQSVTPSSVQPSTSPSPSSSPSSSSSSSPSNPSNSFRTSVDSDTTLLPATPSLTPVTPVIDNTLPAGWLQKFSNREKKNYWFNVITGESIWVKPSM